MLFWLLTFLVISAAYLYAFPQPTVFYAGVVLLHAFGGVLATVLLIPAMIRLLRNGSLLARVGWPLVAVGAVLGVILIKTGTPRTEWNWLYLHIVISLVGVGLLIADQIGRRGRLASNAGASILRAAICLALLAGIGYGARYVRESWQRGTKSKIRRCRPTTWMGRQWTGGRFSSSAGFREVRKLPSSSFMSRFLQALSRRYL